MGEDVTGFEADDFGVEEEGFVYVVGDGDGGKVAVGEPGFHAGDKVVAEFAINAGEGFVEEDEAGAGGGEGSGEVGALTFAAGELMRVAVGEGMEIEEGESFVDEEGFEGRFGTGFEGEADVFLNGQVGKQRGALWSEGQVAVVRWAIRK